MLNFDKRLWMVKQKEKGVLTDQEIADSQNTTRMTLNRLWRAYRNNGIEALRFKSIGKKADAIPSSIKQAILTEFY